MDVVKKDMQRVSVTEDDTTDTLRLGHMIYCVDPKRSSQTN